MEDNKTVEVVKEKKKKTKIIIILIIFITLLFAFIIFAFAYAIPKVKEEGISGLFNPIKLTKEESTYYNLYLPELEKYSNLKEENYSYSFRLYYFEGVDSPVIALEHDNNNYTTRMPHDKITLFYIKDGKVITNEYGDISDIKIIYNTEKDELDYYLIQIQDYKQYTYTLLKDIVTESNNPYVVKLSSDEEFSTTYKSDGSKVAVPKNYITFVDGLDNYVENKVYDQIFSFNDGIDKFKGYLKKAISSKYYLKDLLTTSTREKALEKISQYNISPGQKILDDNNSSTSNEIPSNNVQSYENNNSQSQQTTSKCNDGFAYVDDYDSCYSSTDSKDQINRCSDGEIDLTGDCGTAVDASLCQSGDEEYEEINGICIDKYTLHPKSIECPSGYDILFGNYSGQTFNGACYRYMSPNN